MPAGGRIWASVPQATASVNPVPQLWFHIRRSRFGQRGGPSSPGGGEVPSPRVLRGTATQGLRERDAICLGCWSAVHRGVRLQQAPALAPLYYLFSINPVRVQASFICLAELMCTVRCFDFLAILASIWFNFDHDLRENHRRWNIASLTGHLDPVLRFVLGAGEARGLALLLDCGLILRKMRVFCAKWLLPARSNPFERSIRRPGKADHVASLPGLGISRVSYVKD
jgi:hypothetical protein